LSALATPLRIALALATAALVGGALGSCQTVDLGSPPADINACRPSQSFFVREVWPNVLAADYGGKHCSDAKCHDPASGRPLTLIANPQPDLNAGFDPMNPAPIPNPLPADWAANYRSASEQMNCSNPSASDLVARPTAQRTHGAPKLFGATDPPATTIEMWVSGP
jgi:hypothetical protein